MQKSVCVRDNHCLLFDLNSAELSYLGDIILFGNSYGNIKATNKKEIQKREKDEEKCFKLL